MKISVMRFSSERGTHTLHNGKALGGNHGGSDIFYLFLFCLFWTKLIIHLPSIIIKILNIPDQSLKLKFLCIFQKCPK